MVTTPFFRVEGHNCSAIYGEAENPKKRNPKPGIGLVDVEFKLLNYVEGVQKSVYGRMIAERKQIAGLAPGTQQSSIKTLSEIDKIASVKTEGLERMKANRWNPISP